MSTTEPQFLILTSHLPVLLLLQSAPHLKKESPNPVLQVVESRAWPLTHHTQTMGESVRLSLQTTSAKHCSPPPRPLSWCKTPRFLPCLLAGLSASTLPFLWPVLPSGIREVLLKYLRSCHASAQHPPTSSHLTQTKASVYIGL